MLFYIQFIHHGRQQSLIGHVLKSIYTLYKEGKRFSPGTLVSSTNKTGRHDITEILLKVALNTINQIKKVTSFTPLTSKHCKLIRGNSAPNTQNKYVVIKSAHDEFLEYLH